jgi:hypothetical protein
METQIFYEYDASKEAPEVTQAIEIAVEEVTKVTSAMKAGVEELLEIEDTDEKAPELTEADEVGAKEAPEVPRVTSAEEVVLSEEPKELESAPSVENAVEESPVEPDTGMRKHKYNILPEMTAEEYAALKESIQKNGYDRLNFPIIVTATENGDEIIDGWNRYKVCQELGIEPTRKRFEGSDEEVLEFILKTNTRRNLTPEQWAVLAVKNKEILQTIRKQVEATTAEKMLAGKSDPTTSVSRVKKDKNNCTTKAIVAKKVNTTPKLLAAVENLKEENPEEFSHIADGILKGDTTVRKIKAEKKKAAALLTTAENVNVIEGLSDSQDNENTYIEMTDKEILELITLAKIEVEEIAEKVVTEGPDYKTLPINQQHFQAIGKIHTELGQVLTNYKNLKYGKNQ